MGRISRKLSPCKPGPSDAIEPDTAVDGELVAFDDEGELSFNALQNAASGTHVVFFAFDVLVSVDKDVESYPLRDRKAGKHFSDWPSRAPTMHNCLSTLMAP